jgi:hypothetical protein
LVRDVSFSDDASAPVHTDLVPRLPTRPGRTRNRVRQILHNLVQTRKTPWAGRAVMLLRNSSARTAAVGVWLSVIKVLVLPSTSSSVRSNLRRDHLAKAAPAWAWLYQEKSWTSTVAAWTSAHRVEGQVVVRPGKRYHSVVATDNT